jgi:hypothetical protein
MLAQVEKHPDVAGADLQNRLSNYWGLSFSTLAKSTDPQAMTVRFVQSLEAKGFV